MVARKRRKFTDEFKAETVRLVREHDKTIGQVARELDSTRLGSDPMWPCHTSDANPTDSLPTK